MHGIAGPLGGLFDIPHGVACAGLVAKANEVNLRALLARGDDFYVRKMARIGRLFKPAGEHNLSNQNLSNQVKMDASQSVLVADCEHLTNQLLRWKSLFKVPEFAAYGITASDLPRIVRAASNRNNPVKLKADEIETIIQHAI